VKYRLAIVPRDASALNIAQVGTQLSSATASAGTLCRDVDTDADGYWLTDPTGRFFEVSPSAGLVEIYPLDAVRQIVVVDVPA